MRYELRGEELVGRSLPRRPDIGAAEHRSLPFLESVPEVSAKLKEPVSAERKFDDVVKSAQPVAVLVLVYRIRKSGNQEGRSKVCSWLHGFLIETKNGALPVVLW
jgi:hypothetical protein